MLCTFCFCVSSDESFCFAAFKETAFLLAVSSAALTHALAKACSSGRMERCTCDESPGIQHREAWQWGVCGDNLKYSTKFLKKFLGQKRVSKDLRAQVDAHNINVGIRVSERETQKQSCSEKQASSFLREFLCWAWGVENLTFTCATRLNNNYTLLCHQQICDQTWKFLPDKRPLVCCRHRPWWSEGWDKKTAAGWLEPGVLRHDKACCAGPAEN